MVADTWSSFPEALKLRMLISPDVKYGSEPCSWLTTFIPSLVSYATAICTTLQKRT